jgi:hypothetical protein
MATGLCVDGQLEPVLAELAQATHLRLTPCAILLFSTLEESKAESVEELSRISF